MKPVSERAPLLLVIQIQIKAVCTTLHNTCFTHCEVSIILDLAK